MPAAADRVGTYEWTVRSGGHLTPAERRSLLVPLIRAHAENAVGRLAMATHVNSGRRVTLKLERTTPSSVLTRAAQEHARHHLSPVLLNHSYRTYAFGMDLAALMSLEVDEELLFTAAMLHDVGLAGPRQPEDFTLAGARAAQDVAEAVGLSGTAMNTVCDAITLHHSPGVTLDDGPVAYLLSAGAGVDVLGFRSWKLPPSALDDAVTDWPRLGFKREFGQIWRAESVAVPAGRAQFLRRYGAIGLALRLAPFRD